MTKERKAPPKIEAVNNLSEGALERIDALFVQNASSSSSDEGTVTLHSVADSTVYFADRPRREVGHIPSRRFIELWENEENGFALDPPNAVLSFLDDDGPTPDDVVVVLREPRLDGHELTYTVDVLEGTLPERSGPCALFIDVFARAFSPASVAGVQRPASRRKH
jgi:hypothetical protein